MHQDSLRSVVYRSFVNCDDPKGVVECGTIRKSKGSSRKMEHKIKSQKAKKVLDSSFTSKAVKKEKMVSKGITEEFHSPSSFQLLEVSRGAEKLNQMIESLSMGKSYDGKSQDVAQDLLKGSLDLQESLMMLGKLQEASKYMAWLKKKQEESNRGRNCEVSIQRANSCPFGNRNYQMGFQKPRLSADGSVGDSYEELRNCIRDGLARQNLLPKKHAEEKVGFRQRYLDSASEIASTSSSQSTLSRTNNYSSTDSTRSSTTSQKKAKGPSLIAKLMGLDEIPSQPLQNQLKNEKIPQRPMFDVDMRKIRKSQSVGQHEKPELRTLKEILDTMHFTGLMKSKYVKEFSSYPHHSNDSHANQRLIGNTPPIVLIKPLRGQFLEAEEPFSPMFDERDVQDTNMLKNLKVKEELPSKKADRKEKVLKPGKMGRNTDTEESLIKRLSKEDGAKESKKVAEKPEEGAKESNIKQKGGNKKNASVHITHQLLKKEVPDKKADKNQKAIVTSRKPIEKEIEKSKNTSRSQDESKASAKKVRKPENTSNVPKNHTRRQQTSTQNTMLNHTKQTVNHTGSAVHTLSDRKRILKRREEPVTEPSTARLTTENIGCKEDEKRMDFASKVDSAPIENNDTCVDQLLAEEETDASMLQIGELCYNSQSSFCDANAILLTSKCERETVSVEEVDDDTSPISTEIKIHKSGTDMKLLLSSNPVFISHAEVLFDLNVNSPTSLQTSGINDFVATDERLYMDCANELIKRMSLPDSKMTHPLLLTWLKNPRICLSLDRLLEEVSEGVEILKSYSKLPGESLSTDSLYAILEKDISCKGVVNGVWDLGWRNEFSAQDTEKVVSDIEKLVLSRLIDEIFP